MNAEKYQISARKFSHAIALLIGETMIGQNDDFIAKRCDICGGEDCAGAALSRLRLICGYGSAYDTERVELTICGECADKIYTLIHRESE